MTRFQTRVAHALSGSPRAYRVARFVKLNVEAVALATARALRVPATRLHRQARSMRSALVRGVASGEKVLVFTGYQDSAALALESALGFRLQALGHEVEFIRCDRFQGYACNLAVNPGGLDPAVCMRCHQFSAGYIQDAGFASWGLSAFAQDGDVQRAAALTAELSAAACRALVYREQPLGQLVRVQIARYLMDHRVRDDDETTRVYRDFLATAIRVVDAVERAFDVRKPTRLLMCSGNYLAERVAMAVARRRGLEVTAWDGGYRPGATIFSRNKPQDNNDARAWARWRDVSLTEVEESQLDELLAGRRTGTGTVQKYQPMSRVGGDALLRSLGLAAGHPTAVLFTNLAFDTSIFERDIVYADYLSWIVDTVKEFAQHPEWQLIVRTHPAERFFRVPLAKRIATDLLRAFDELPPNVRVITSDETIDSYALMDLAWLGLVANSTTGIEMAVSGTTVVTVAAAQFRGKGFTLDPSTRSEYLSAIADAMRARQRSDDVRRIARRYCYFTFFRLTVRIGIRADGGLTDVPDFSEEGMAKILHGDPTLDRIARSIVGEPDYVAPPDPARVAKGPGPG